MNTVLRASLALAFGAASLAAGAQTATRLTQDAHNKTLSATLRNGSSYAFRSGSDDPLAQTGQPGQNIPPAAKDDLFAGVEQFAKNAVDATEINMDPDSLDMVKGPERARAHGMVLNVVRTYRYDKPGMYNMVDVDAYRNKLNTGDWHCSVHVRQLKTGQSTDVCERHRTDGLRERAIITAEPKALTFIHQITREDGGPGHSDLGVMPFSFAGPLPVIAALDMADLVDLPLELGALQALDLDLPALQHPFKPEQMKKLREQLKDRKTFKFVVPGGGDKPLPDKPATEKPRE